MFLKRVEIFGFKSFADKSKIDFGEGISTIVGPNGCGKSNVVDAIRWVLGEQSTKGMRLEKMSNVIFNGTDQRHPLNVAEVTLTFSNENNILPLEFSEVSIKRRIFRSSNSEYYINDNQVTLKELRDIIADTGIGVTEYIVMEQGRVDQILEAKPVDRREILEEAAGIKKFRVRSLEGTRRREKVRENIVQIEQILQEVERQHKTLKAQSEKAIRYRTFSDIVFSCEVAMECKKYLDFSVQLTNVNSKLKTEENNLEKEQQQQKKLEDDNLEFQSKIKDREAESIELQKRHSVILTEKDGLQRIIITNIEHIKETSAQYEELKNELHTLSLRKKTQEEEILTFEKDRKKEIEILSKISQSIDDNLKKSKKNKQEISSLLETKQNLGQRILLTQKALEEHQQDLRTVVDRLAEELDKRITQSGYSANTQNKLEASMLGVCQNLKKEIGRLQTKITKIIKSNKELQIKDIETHIELIKDLSNSTDEAFRSYRDSVPTFLNEFLENDGVLSHKHTIDEKINYLHNEQKECRDSIVTVDKNIATLESENHKLLESLYEFEIKKNSTSQKISSIDRDKLRAKQVLKDIEGQIKSQKMRIQSLQKSLEKWKESQLANEKKFGDLEKEETRTLREIDVLKNKIGKQYSAMSAFEKKLASSIKKVEVVYKNILNQKEKITDLEARLTMVSENFRDRHGEMINIYLNNVDYQKKAKKSIEELKLQLSNTKNEMHLLGSVNLLAAEEFERIDERYKHLTGQLEDLMTADKNLQEVIEKIEHESRIKMEKTFAEVRKHFKSIFTRVMGGGIAELELVDSEDILDAGLEIYAQPPEKKTQYLSQLSGGERTLIALSLLFSLHSVKPAPFCLLDELDAPLDDRNIDRFLDLLYGFKHLTQFVIISHNKRSIAQSQNIIGVTMEERGVSKFIGVKINEE